jgi:quercetin 2,3-dioxygenase
MTTTYHMADTRGYADHGWLKTYHTFSFANYYDPERVHFGALRVLNDDHVEAGHGFGTHPHDNMEIISIPLEGDLEHRDSMGNVQVIRRGDIQAMSAGTGILHSEKNLNHDLPTKFLQIWVFPGTRDVAPRYDQITLDPAMKRNRLHQIVSPDPGDDGVWIHQNAWFYLGALDSGTELPYTMRKAGDGLYVFVLSGTVTVAEHQLGPRDGLGIEGVDAIPIAASSEAEVLLIEVPMI